MWFDNYLYRKQFDMDKKVIKINEAKIREMVSKNLKRALNESSISKTLRNELYSIWADLDDLCSSLEYKYEDFYESEENSELAAILHKIGVLTNWISENNSKGMNFQLGDDYTEFRKSNPGLNAYDSGYDWD